MVHQQIQTWNVSDRRVLDTLLAVPREIFVPEVYQKSAYTDISIPLADGQTMLLPKIAAHILQALNISSRDHVLEVGTGSGYLTTLLAKLARDVVSVEISPSLHELASATLNTQKIRNVLVELGDGSTGWKKEAPFDAIAVTGSIPVLHDDFQQQLKENGRLFVVVGNLPVMEARLITRVGTDDWKEKVLFETILPPLQQPILTTNTFVL